MEVSLSVLLPSRVFLEYFGPPPKLTWLKAEIHWNTSNLSGFYISYFRKKLRLRCWAKFWIRLLSMHIIAEYGNVPELLQVDNSDVRTAWCTFQMFKHACIFKVRLIGWIYLKLYICSAWNLSFTQISKDSFSFYPWIPC